jgi:CBS domain-containing protein
MNATLERVFTPNIIFVQPDLSMERAAQIMRNNKVRCLAVGSAERCDGVLTERDVDSAACYSVCEWQSTAVLDKVFDPRFLIRHFMHPPKIVGKHSSINEVLSALVENPSQVWLVRDGARVVGSVGAQELLSFALNESMSSERMHLPFGSLSRSPLQTIVQSLSDSGI